MKLHGALVKNQKGYTQLYIYKVKDYLPSYTEEYLGLQDVPIKDGLLLTDDVLDAFGQPRDTVLMVEI